MGDDVATLILMCCFIRLMFSQRKGLNPIANLMELVMTGKKTGTCRQMKARTKSMFKRAMKLRHCVRFQSNYGHETLFGWGRIDEFIEDVKVCDLFLKFSESEFLRIVGCANFSRQQYLDEFCGGDDECVVCFLRFTFFHLTVSTKTVLWCPPSLHPLYVLSCVRPWGFVLLVCVNLSNLIPPRKDMPSKKRAQVCESGHLMSAADMTSRRGKSTVPECYLCSREITSGTHIIHTRRAHML